MGIVRLHALGIDELRDVCVGTDATVQRLRALALAAWPPAPTPSPRQGGLLRKLGPFSRHAVGAPIVRQGVPTSHDLDDVAHGRDVPADRRTAAWALVGAWVDDLAWGSLEVDATDADIDDLDFALATAGVPSRYGLRQLFAHGTALPVKLLPGMRDGYARGTHAVAMASAWRGALGALPTTVEPRAATIAGWLDRFTGWTHKADEAGRPAPDLVVWFRS
ncbi:MAG: hypothetical protein Q4F65_02885 [Propionibacteriaceae bacterium]|nr:hypothetical protein [Propionibacteriaceae bacterium]